MVSSLSRIVFRVFTKSKICRHQRKVMAGAGRPPLVSEYSGFACTLVLNIPLLSWRIVLVAIRHYSDD